MRSVARVAAFAAVGFVLPGCASPYFVHDPQTFIINRSEVPHLIKALRCELATFIAANNQRRVLFQAVVATKGIGDAIAKYPYFEMDTQSFGGVALDLKIQDTIGVQPGTQFDWKQSADMTHSKAWNLGPTAGDQSTYEVLWNFVVPQDTYFLDNFSPSSHVSLDRAPRMNADSFPCYKNIPHNPNPPFPVLAALQDLDGLAAGDYPELANFTRVRVDGTTPFASWLQKVSVELGVTSFLSKDATDPEAIHPAQMVYTFTIQVSGGFDAKYSVTSSPWILLAGEGSASVQQTSVMTLVLNGLEAQDASGVKGGNVKNNEANPLPVIVSSARPGQKYKFTKEYIRVPKSGYVGRTQSRGTLTYPIPLSPLGVQ